MSSEPNEQLIKQAVASTVGRCTNCREPYDAESVSILGHQDELWFLSLLCGHCQAQGLVAALIKEQPTAVNGVSVDDEQPIESSAPVDADDVLDVHEYLKHFDGDFATLFRR